MFKILRCSVFTFSTSLSSGWQDIYIYIYIIYIYGWYIWLVYIYIYTSIYLVGRPRLTSLEAHRARLEHRLLRSHEKGRSFCRSMARPRLTIDIVDLPSYMAWWFSSSLCKRLPEGKSNYLISNYFQLSQSHYRTVNRKSFHIRFQSIVNPPERIISRHV